ncbi:hypothetical protein [Timonella senegalensis]|uniref:hypothetical protein n=1 Tax=Timonella senegalensis TaxID=1465825 RepID=UPI0028B01D37|nr:hypothetical protein [Timonella senegalensis]
MTNNNTPVEKLANDLDLLALPILTGTLKDPKPPTLDAQVGDFILNIRPYRSGDGHTTMTGRIASIDWRGAAYNARNQYLGRINGHHGWETRIIEPATVLPTQPGSLIIIHTYAGQKIDRPAMYDPETRSFWALDELTEYASALIEDWSHAKVVTA